MEATNPSHILITKKNIAKDVKIGPWTYIGPDVIIDSGTEIGSHVVINGPTKIGKRCKIHSFASIGGDSQDKKYQGETSYLEIGDDNIFREYVTINRGNGGSSTKIGNNNLFMAYVHIAHDCIVGNNNVFSNSATLAGHVTIGNHCILSGFSGFHQFCTMGSYSFLGMRACVSKDVVPFTLVAGAEAAVKGLNLEGLKRHNFSDATIELLKNCYKIIFRQGLTLKKALELIKQQNYTNHEVQILISFLENVNRGILR